MDTRQKMGSGSQPSTTSRPRVTNKKNEQQKKGWNLAVDLETHQALDILGAWMVGKEKMHKDLKESIQIPKSKVIKILVLEKLESLRKKSEVAKV